MKMKWKIICFQMKMNDSQRRKIIKLIFLTKSKSSEAKKIIIELNDPGLCYKYARDILHSKFEEAEDLIAKESSASYSYAMNIIHGRFEKGEEIISKYAQPSFWYSIKVINSRFIKGEGAIKLHLRIKENYEKTFKINL